ncbi:DNA polymerase III subunit gamma/tau [Candidatus Kaiserbacteria bacterium]|nr:DNA polymerase III subunit gamma/tau [Candidatus Kaiserbacteria bacterium]
MTEYTALYRKYRPNNFGEVLDQDHIVQVLKGAIEKKQIPHALLFSGTRGTGKTTLARIFASALGTKAVDIYEMDAASNRGIDDIRELKEAVYTLPYESEKKVYIIDEVHMLTKDAFNALLKTLEEPPSHVVFILATTEEDKLLDTILSRCQIFRFRSPSREVLKKTVTDISEKEGFTLTPEAADMIAIAADGSFRDALGVTQKVILASGDTIGSADEVATIIGAPKNALLQDLVEAISSKNAELGIETIRKAIGEHVEMKLFIRLLLERVRAVILLRNAPNQKDILLASFSTEDQTQLEALAGDKTNIHSHTLLRLLEAAEQTQKAQITQLPLELALVEICEK